MIGLDSYSRQVFNYLDPILIYISLGVQLLVFFCSSVSVVLFDTPGISRCLSSPHLCFIIVFICDLFVSRDDPLMS